MKLFKKIPIIAVICASFGHLQASKPASTYTFVAPCLPFAAITPIPGDENCFSFSITNVQAGDQDVFYAWDFGDGQQAQGIMVFHCYTVSASAMQKTVTVTNNSPYCQVAPPLYNTYQVMLSASSPSNCNYEVVSVVLNAQSVTVNPSPGPEIPEVHYIFDYGDGTGTVQAASHTYPGCGNYIIKIARYDLTNTVPCYIFAAVNMTCAGTVTGLDTYAAKAQLKVFPDPASTELTVSSAGPVKNISIFDLSGRKIVCPVTEKENTSSYDIKVEQLLQGIYMLRLSFEDGSDKNIRFIKE